MSNRRIVIVGGGPAGVGAALAARQQDATAEVLLLTDEGCEPYEKPPLSKAVLTGKVTPHDAPIAGPKGVAGFNIIAQAERAGDARSTAWRALSSLRAASGFPTTRWCSRPARSTACCRCSPPGSGASITCAPKPRRLALKAHLGQSKSLIVIGGGLIGLEVAASAAELGLKTTVIEIAPRILARVADEETSALVHERHRAHGVDIRLATAVAALHTLPDRQVSRSTSRAARRSLPI